MIVFLMSLITHITMDENNTDLLAQMNSTHLANDYINQTVALEQSRVGKLDANAKRDVYKLRGQSLGVVYTEGRCKFLSMLTRVVLLASMIVLAVLSVTAQEIVSKRTGVVLAVVVMILTGVALLFMVSGAAQRRNDAWGHFYWGSGRKNGPGTAGQCASST